MKTSIAMEYLPAECIDFETPLRIPIKLRRGVSTSARRQEYFGFASKYTIYNIHSLAAIQVWLYRFFPQKHIYEVFRHARKNNCEKRRLSLPHGIERLPADGLSRNSVCALFSTICWYQLWQQWHWRTFIRLPPRLCALWGRRNSWASSIVQLK